MNGFLALGQEWDWECQKGVPELRSTRSQTGIRGTGSTRQTRSTESAQRGKPSRIQDVYMRASQGVDRLKSLNAKLCNSCGNRSTGARKQIQEKAARRHVGGRNRRHISNIRHRKGPRRERITNRQG